MRLPRLLISLLVLGGSCWLHASSLVQGVTEPFDDYRERLRLHFLERKAWVDPSAQGVEVEAVLPFEHRPQEHCRSDERVGVLMFHGLSDSPFSLRDPARAIAEQCLHTRVMLLPGHGSKAEDLLSVSREDWRLAVSNAVEQFSGEVDTLYLAGFSTGGALVTEYAWQYPDDIQGVVLFSPLFKINSRIDWLAPILAPFIDWLDHHPSDDYAKYASIPVPAIAQAYKLAKEVKQTVLATPAQAPVFLALSEEDATVDSSVTLEVFEHSLAQHPDSAMVLYSVSQAEQTKAQVQIVNTDLPEQRIFGLAHMAVHGAPHNPYYGAQGEYRICAWYLGDRERYNECRLAQNNWYGERSEALSERSELAARLSWNPYFDDLMQRVSGFIATTSESSF
ncbi:Thermostable monoacylglycerol lipase [Marinomonas aquimarina]|uniref:Thermostable monoacylglycerol lipase n=1 Tax=Marinomonas aquimarina TaxID=295068 RepID=A0A1A8T9A9_9GAMM|nr:alpha/beta fold hydrolase [Marinomonas aquimarina]SBS29311.1 Thermostable monoacylglycerol lipase [Marinomonas aquimarina]